MNLQSFKKYFYIVLLIPITFFTFTYFNAPNSRANINKITDNEYTVDSGDDLFRILSTDYSYWSGNNTPPQNLKINVITNITLPGYMPYLSSKLKQNNITVDFHENTFYVEGAGSSALKINDYNTNLNITISNLNIENTNGNNIVNSVPSTNGQFKTNANSTSFFGLLFSADFGSKPSNTRITYNNINYNVTKGIAYNQPFCTYKIPINFTGNNSITTTNNGEQLGEIPNIHVSSGTTTLQGNGYFAGGMFTPDFDYSTFPIDVDSNASLNLINNSNQPMFGNNVGNTININNSGNLNIKNTYNPFATNFMRNFILNANPKSNTSLISNGSSIIPNLIKDNSSINLNSVAKFLAYSNSPISEPAINTTFNGNGQIQQFNFKSNPADYNSNLGTYSAKSSFSNGYTRKFGDDLLYDRKYNAFSVTSDQNPLQFITAPTGNYRWDIPINTLKSDPNYVSRTDGNDFSFNVEDDSQQDFSISASYNPKEKPQPFKMLFKKDDNAEKDIELNQTPTPILSKSEMTNNGNNYTKSFDTSHGLIIKANNHVKAKSYSGTVDWTVSNQPS